MEADHCTHIIPINLMWSNIPVLTCVLYTVPPLVSLHYCTAILGCGRYTVLLVSEVVGGERTMYETSHDLPIGYRFFKQAILLLSIDDAILLWEDRFHLKNKNGPRGDASVLPLERSIHTRDRNLVKASTAWLMLQGKNHLFCIELLHISDMLHKDNWVTLKEPASEAFFETLFDSSCTIFRSWSRLQRKTPVTLGVASNLHSKPSVVDLGSCKKFMSPADRSVHCSDCWGQKRSYVFWSLWQVIKMATSKMKL